MMDRFASPIVSASRSATPARYSRFFLRKAVAELAKQCPTVISAALFSLLLASLAKAQQMPGMTMEPALSKAIPDLPPLARPINLLIGLSHRPSLTLEDLLARALATNPALTQARALTTRSEALARQSSLYPNPTIGYQGDQIRGGSFGGGEQGAYLAQTIPLGGKLTLRRNAIEAEASTTRTATEVQQTRIRADLTQAYYAALAAQELARIHRSLLLTAEDATQTAHQLANIGQADAPYLLATEVEQEQAQLADEEAQRKFLSRFHILAILSGDPTLPPTSLKADLTASPSASLSQLPEDNPVIQQARAEISAAEARLASAHREVAPDLQLKAGEQYNFEQLGSAASRSPAARTGPQTFASAAITLPLWNRNQGNIRAAESDLAIARENLRRVQAALRADAEPLLEALAVAQAQADRYRSSILPRATWALELYEQRYNQMAQAYPQVLTARRTLLEHQLRYTDTLATIWRTTIALQNWNLSGSLGPIGGAMPLQATIASPLD